MARRACAMASRRAAAAAIAWASARAREASTYRGLALVVGVVAAWVNPDKAAAAAAVAAACVGMVEVFRKG